MILCGCSITADMFFLSLQLEFHQKIRNSMNNGEEMIITGPCVCSYSPLRYGGLTSTTLTSFPIYMTPFIVPCLKEAGQQSRMRLDVKWEQQGGTRSWEGKNRRLCLSTDFISLVGSYKIYSHSFKCYCLIYFRYSSFIILMQMYVVFCFYFFFFVLLNQDFSVLP